jgi:hypothetical protein
MRLRCHDRKRKGSQDETKPAGCGKRLPVYTSHASWNRKKHQRLLWFLHTEILGERLALYAAAGKGTIIDQLRCRDIPRKNSADGKSTFHCSSKITRVGWKLVGSNDFH